MPRMPLDLVTTRRVLAKSTPSNYVVTLQLSAGMETYVQVEPVPNWEVGSVGGGSFIVASMSPQEARPYLPLMQNLGPR